MQKEQLVKLKIKNIIKSFLDEKITPLEIRLQLAKGLIPLETNELITAFFYSLFDSREEVKNAARESIKTLPESMLIKYLSFKVPESVLNYFSKVKRDSEKCLEAIILNKNTSTITIKSLADNVSEKLAIMIADNQQRIIKDPEIVDCLERNENVHVSLLEKLRTFLAMFEQEPEDESEYEEVSMQEMLSGEALLDQLDKADEKRVEDLAEEEDPEDYDKSITEAPSDDELEQYTAEEVESLKLSTYKRIQSMSIAEKIQEALKGSREARSILIKDSNKLVSSAVVKSPKVTEDEIVKVTASRNISDEVLRIICQKDEWLRNYQIKLNLVNNPKTPFRTTIKFMNFLRKKDLIALSKSKMVPNQVAATARKLAAKKRN